MSAKTNHHPLPDIDPSIALAQARQHEMAHHLAAGGSRDEMPLPHRASLRKHLAGLFASLVPLRAAMRAPFRTAEVRERGARHGVR